VCVSVCLFGRLFTTADVKEITQIHHETFENINGFHWSIVTAVGVWVLIRNLNPDSISILFKLQDSASFSLLELYIVLLLSWQPLNGHFLL
jgi:hypothetical protein